MLITRENWDFSVCKGLLQMIPMIPSPNTEQQPASNSKWISNRHLQLNMSEIKLLVYPLNVIIPPNQWQHHSFKDWRTETDGHPWSLSLIPFSPANLAALPAVSWIQPHLTTSASTTLIEPLNNSPRLLQCPSRCSPCFFSCFLVSSFSP